MKPKNKSIHALAILALLMITAEIPCSAAAMDRLKVKTIKQIIDIPFTPQTTIAQIKVLLEQSEGIPVRQIKLVKNEGFMLSFPPKQLCTTLEDGQTCGQYGLINGSMVQMWLNLRPLLNTPSTQASQQG